MPALIIRKRHTVLAGCGAGDGRRAQTLRRGTATLMAATALLAPAAALASDGSAPPVPGATYSGAAGDGTVAITVSPDGTLVTAYSFVGVHGTNSKGGGCTVGGQAATPSWGGAPISGSSFDYAAPGSFDLAGSFDGPQSVGGTLTITVAPSGASDGCSTGAIRWAAATTSTPPAPASGPAGVGTGGSPGPSGSGGGGVSGASQRKPLVVHISLRRRSTSRLVGNLRSSDRRCFARRTVTLWHGRKRVGTRHSTASGGFSFTAGRVLRDKPVRATVKAVSVGSVSCAASSSTFVNY